MIFDGTVFKDGPGGIDIIVRDFKVEVIASYSEKFWGV